MDNAIDALKIAFAVFVFVMALSISMSALSQAKTVSDEVFYMTPSGRAIKPRTLGQRLYVDSLKQSELVICCGPAGTQTGLPKPLPALQNRCNGHRYHPRSPRYGPQ